MTAQGEDILAYLDSAITAREEAAYAAPRSPWSVRVDDDEIVAPDGITVAEAFALSGQQTRAILDLIALHQPASVLRRCAADRKLIDLHRPQVTGAGFPDIQECRTCSADSLGDGYQYLVPAPCPTLLALAEGHGWTEGER
ncbi:DUF6221 family protein [Streptomyces sp. NPDC048209]|uniref:DUF6221 family protein n=1 Tax=Streptomyces sp. NPDC048209 TaxID=3156689 RepID=UPI00343AA909